jgi:hypothetical protein
VGFQWILWEAAQKKVSNLLGSQLGSFGAYQETALLLGVAEYAWKVGAAPPELSGIHIQGQRSWGEREKDRY